MDISRVISDAGTLTVRIPSKGESNKAASTPVQSEEFTIDKVDVPQKQIAKIVRSAEELLQEKNSTETSPKATPLPSKGSKFDEYA